MNQHLDPVEPSQIQPPSSHKQPTSHDNQPSTSALPQFPDSLGDQLTNSPIRIHRLHSNLQFRNRRKFQHYHCHDQR